MLKDHSWEDIAAALEKARTRQPALSELLGFYERLLKEQHATTVNLEPIPSDEAHLRDRNGKGKALLSREEFPLDPVSAGALFRSLCRLAKERGDSGRAGVEGIESALASGSP